jgi:hypothetical protein
MEELRALIQTLPPENRRLLKALIEFILVVQEHQEVNKMSLRNLAIVIGPNIFRPESNAEFIDASTYAIELIVVLGENFQLFFSVFNSKKKKSAKIRWNSFFSSSSRTTTRSSQTSKAKLIPQQ